MSNRAAWIRAWQKCGASVIGPAHVETGMPNQDSWLYFSGAYGVGIVVCDGLGSKSHSDFGSKAGCVAVRQAIGIWSKEKGATHEQLLRLIHQMWNMKVELLGRRNCSTTCIFALVQPDKQIFLAQLGDGAAIIESPERGLEGIQFEREGFVNETTGLGIATNLNEWKTAKFEGTPGTHIVLATDGVSEDLAGYGPFVTHLKSRLRNKSPREQTNSLRSLLTNWPREDHYDDKTLALLWHKGRARKKN
jgi:serine/threonine protein phosphatase PrpC